MKTYEEITNAYDKLEAEASKIGYTDEINAKFKALYDEEMALNMENAVAIANAGDIIIFMVPMVENIYAIHIKTNGEWECAEEYSAVKAMEKFAKLARRYEIKHCLVHPAYLDRKGLEEDDKRHMELAEEEEYADACMASNYGDDSLLERYNRRHGIEKDYGPSNPWDAPGMSIHDFI